MARALNELLGPSSRGPQDTVLLTNTVLLQDGSESWSVQSHLISFVSEADAHRRIDLLAASLACGRCVITSSSTHRWIRNFFHQRHPEPMEASVVLAIPISRLDTVGSLNSGRWPPHFAPVVVVTDDASAFRKQSSFPADTVIQAPLGDLLGTAISVFRMMAALSSPAAFTCSDLIDVMQVLHAGESAQLCLPLWSAQTGLLFSSPVEKRVLKLTKGVLVHLCLESIGSLQVASQIRREVLECMDATATAITIGPANFFVRGDQCGFQTVPLLCIYS